MTFAPQQQTPVGTISEILAKSILREVENDGDHTYLHIQEECKSQLPINTETKNCVQPLTNVGVHITQFDQSFITVEVKVGFRLSEALSTTAASSGYTDYANLVRRGTKLFIGFKHNTDCLREYSIYHKGHLVNGTLQSNGARESFLYHSVRGQDDLEYHKGEHSIAEAVAHGDSASYCGVYVPLEDLQSAGSGIFYETFSINIPYNDILPFQAFDAYPNAIFGMLELYFKFNKDALVYMQVDPAETIDREYNANYSTYSANINRTNGDLFISSIKTRHPDFTREYTQINDPATIIEDYNITGTSSTTISTKEITLNAVSMQIVNCFATVIGEKMLPEALEAEKAKYLTTPWVKPSQMVEYYPYATSPSQSGINATQQIELKNVTDFIITFPQTEHEITVSKNPMLKGFYLNTLNRNYPELALNTDSARFQRIMMNAADIYRSKCLREFAQSISTARGDASGALIPQEDLTSFMIILHVERPSAMGLICDGLDSDGHQVSVRIQGTPIYSGEGIDTYCANSPPPPVLYVVYDTFWAFNSQNEGTCIYSDRPFNDEIDQFMSE